MKRGAKTVESIGQVQKLVVVVPSREELGKILQGQLGSLPREMGRG